jgi:hypothetical protein
MIRRTFGLVAAAAIAATAACSDSTSPSSSTSPLLVAAFLSTPAGFSSTDNSFSASGDAGEPWMPDRGAHDDGGMMGGGLRPEFFGGIGIGRGWDRGPFGLDELLENCTLASTGRVTCPDVTRRGLTISRSFAFMDAAGTAQAAPNSSTNNINEQVAVSGTVTRHDGDVTSTVQENSDRTVSGLASGSTQRTVNGASKGSENSTGKTRDGTAFTASRVVGDTTTGLVVPLQDGHPTFPTAGTVIREITAKISIDGKDPVTKSRREVITYDGSSTAKVVITKDGATKNCTLPLPFGRLQCQ